MDDQPIRTIPRSVVSTLLDRLPLLRVKFGSREFDVDLFCAIDARHVRQATRSMSDIIEGNPPPEAADWQRGISPIVHQEWVSETIAFDTDYEDDEGELVFTVSPFGYLNKEGNFVEWPSLDPIPCFTSSIADAMEFKSRVWQSYLKFDIAEVDGEWGSDYVVRLVSATEDVVSAYQSDALPHAIVGSVLTALLNGWTHDLAVFEVIEG